MLKQFSLYNVLFKKSAEQKLVVLDVPLLFETKYLTYFTSKNIVVYAPDEIQLPRLMKRNNLSKEDAEARIKAQMPMQDKVKMANVIIDNTGDLKQLEEQVAKAVETVKKGAWTFGTQYGSGIAAVAAVAVAGAASYYYNVKSKM